MALGGVFLFAAADAVFYLHTFGAPNLPHPSGLDTARSLHHLTPAAGGGWTAGTILAAIPKIVGFAEDHDVSTAKAVRTQSPRSGERGECVGPL